MTGSSSPDPQQLAIAEIDRQRRVIDQMITAHSVLRDRYHRRSLVMTSGLLAASTVAIAFAFATVDVAVRIGPVVAQRSTWLGWFAVLTFVVTLVELVVDWKGSMRRHDDAVRQLSMLKVEYRTPPEPGRDLAEKLSLRYEAAMDAIPTVPDRFFSALKAAHLRKVEISRILSDYPGITVRAARRKLRSKIDGGTSS